MLSLTSLATCLVTLAVAAPAINRRGSPTVELEYATIVGSSTAGVDSFKGIPFAQPPVGELRLKPPQPITTGLGTVTATGIPQACPQMYISLNPGLLSEDVLADVLDSPLFQEVTDTGEDCLTLNVQRPSSATANSKLPVVFWMFGGGFQFGSTQLYDGTSLVLNSTAQGKDIIFVGVNYRVGGFGFMPGSEILKDGSANIGHLDQRLGLQWVADNIAQFGGDPEQVTIWGESAGSISVFNQMSLYNGNNTYKGKPLFRAGIMDSGSILPADPVDCPKGQGVYDAVVSSAGCDDATDSLACLRTLDYTTFLNAANSVSGFLSYKPMDLSYLPRPDGVALTASAEVLAENGYYTKVPFIVGDQEDEGTVLALFQSNITTTTEVVNYFSSIFQDATVEQIGALVDTYPDDPSAGAPFNTGILYELYPQFKRLAAMIGDLTFTLQRRIFLTISSKVNADVQSWSYLASYDDAIPYIGTFHTSDILAAFGYTPGFPSTSIQSYYLSFINTMDPNEGTLGLLEWPQWDDGQQLLNFGAFVNTLTADDFRSESAEFVSNNTAALHL